MRPNTRKAEADVSPRHNPAGITSWHEGTSRKAQRKGAGTVDAQARLQAPKRGSRARG